jgi:hypothetical protein
MRAAGVCDVIQALMGALLVGMLDRRFDLAFEVSLVSFASIQPYLLFTNALVQCKLYTLVNYALQ